MKRRTSTGILVAYAALLLVTVILALVMVAGVTVMGTEFSIRPLSPLASLILLLALAAVAGSRVAVHLRARRLAESSRHFIGGTSVPSTGETPPDEG